jgi:hypothetical protein
MVVGDAGSVYDAAYRWGAIVVARCHQRHHIFAASDVECGDVDGRASPLERPNRGNLVLRFVVENDAVPFAPGRQRCSPRKDHATRTPVDEPMGHQEAEGSHAAGDEVCRIGSTADRGRRPNPLDGHQRRGEDHAVTQQHDRSADVRQQSG